MSNARSAPVKLLGHRWEVTDANGQLHVTQARGMGSEPFYLLKPGTACRIKGALPTLHTRYANVRGRIFARVGEEEVELQVASYLLTYLLT